MRREPADGLSIETAGLLKRYGGVVALDHVDLAVPRAAVGLLGPNGAGKSTLLKILLGLSRPNGGSARVLGRDAVADGRELRMRVGYMPETDTLPDNATAADFVGHMAEMSGVPRRTARQRAADVLYQVGLDEERYRLVKGFSTGMKQRVKLAQAIVHDPVLVLLDEPTEGLDPVQRDDMLALIRRVGSEFGIHVVISSHLLEEVERICDAAVILREGRVVASGPLSELVGQGRGLLLEVDGRSEVVADRLRARGLLVEVDGSRLTISHLEDEDPALPHAAIDVHDAARDAVVEAGVGIRRLTDRTVRLEDVFLEVGA
jgi:ABC-2 type transport system ATP-binding protein